MQCVSARVEGSQQRLKFGVHLRRTPPLTDMFRSIFSIICCSLASMELMVVRKPTLRVVGVQTRCSPPSCFSVDKSQPHAELCRPRDDLALRGRTTRPWDRNCVWPPLCIRVVARDAPPYAAAYPYACAASNVLEPDHVIFCLVVRHFLPSCASLFA